MCNIYKLTPKVRKDQKYESLGEKKKWVGILANASMPHSISTNENQPNFMRKTSSYTSSQEGNRTVL